MSLMSRHAQPHMSRTTGRTFQDAQGFQRAIPDGRDWHDNAGDNNFFGIIPPGTKLLGEEGKPQKPVCDFLDTKQSTGENIHYCNRLDKHGSPESPRLKVSEHDRLQPAMSLYERSPDVVYEALRSSS